MSIIQFEDEIVIMKKKNLVPKGITGMLIKYGIVKDAKSATPILLGFVVIALVVAGYLILESTKPPEPVPEPPDPGVPLVP